jgi:hypothetical protein
MRLGTFNVENMFERPVAMNLATWADGKAILDDFALLGGLIAKPWYSDEDKAQMLEVMGRHRGLISQGESKFLLLRDVRGQFLEKSGSRAGSCQRPRRLDQVVRAGEGAGARGGHQNTARVMRELVRHAVRRGGRGPRALKPLQPRGAAEGRRRRVRSCHAD